MNPNPSNPRPHRPLDPSQLRPQRRVFDIAPPGRMPASSTSRPIVASRTPAVRDMSVQPQGFGAHRQMAQPPQPAAPGSFDAGRSMQQQPPPGVPVRRDAPPVAPLSTAPHPPIPRAVSSMPLSQPPAPGTTFSLPPRPEQPPVTMPDDSHIVDKIDPIQLNDDEPVLISKHVPQDQSNKWRWIIAASVLFLIFLIIFDILLDADFITLKGVPHTHFF